MYMKLYTQSSIYNFLYLYIPGTCFAGAYVTTSDALNNDVDPEDLWSKGEFEKALALMTTRSLIFQRGDALIGSDKNEIHGTYEAFFTV